MRDHLPRWLMLFLAATSCGSGAASLPDGFTPNALDAAAVDRPAEKRCGTSADAYFSAYTPQSLAMLADCTVLVGRFQQDSVRELEDFSALKHVWKIEGMMNVFRSPGIRSLHGLENLEVVEGDLFIHVNPNLTSIAALRKLRRVSGNLLIVDNPQVPRAELEALGKQVTVGGMKTLRAAEP